MCTVNQLYSYQIVASFGVKKKEIVNSFFFYPGTGHESFRPVRIDKGVGFGRTWLHGRFLMTVTRAIRKTASRDPVPDLAAFTDTRGKKIHFFNQASCTDCVFSDNEASSTQHG